MCLNLDFAIDLTYMHQFPVSSAFALCTEEWVGVSRTVSGMSTLTLAVLIVLVVCAAALAGSIVAFSRTSLPMGEFAGGYVITMDPDGTLRESTIRPSDLTTLMLQQPTRKSTSVMTTGAAALNVTVSVVRCGQRRDWIVSTNAAGVVSVVNQTVLIDLTGTDVLVPSDMPLASSDVDYHVITARYYMAEANRDHVGALFIFPSNSSMVFYPEIINLTGKAPTYPVVPSQLGFDNFHANSTISISAAFTWFVSA